ncbi:MAG: sulfite exporter TauE/SafE family protein [Ruminococcaceae bacterium]|nr:sulfite exporter TauE/SafE family protein [Oscillospiraceae bacterium]
MSGWLISTAAGFLAGAAGAMGLGGGSILLLYLTLIAGVSQIAAQGINLMFFLPCALASVLFSIKSGLIAKREALLGIAAGVPGAIAGCLLAGWLGGGLRTLFGVYMLVLGLRELLRRPAEE